VVTTRLLYDKFLIQQRVREIGRSIDDDYANIDKDLVIIGILKGAFIFLSDLVRILEIPHVIDFMALSSYGLDGKNRGSIKLIMDTRINIKDRDVLVIEDIADTGETLKYLHDVLEARNPASLRFCPLLIKYSSLLSCKKTLATYDYYGFLIPQEQWVIGYGLDHKEQYRTLDSIYEMLDLEEGES
jgi:hypoxanthine phosphoribosyltransferase